MAHPSPQDLLSELLESQRLAALATHSATAPYCNLVAFTATDSLRSILFVTPRGTTKYRNLCAYPAVSLLIDNRSQIDTPAAGMAVTAIGSVQEIEEPKAANLRAQHARRHRDLNAFITSADCALMRIAVEHYIIVTSCRDVVTISVSNQTDDLHPSL